jgi:geranylgeranyl reductase family protein
VKRVAVLGGGPAGAVAAANLAAAGIETIVFDEKLAWEKPCGGGITYKAYDKYPFLIDNDTPKRVVTETIVAAPHAGSATMKLTRPLLIYSRRDLNGMLLERAGRAGASIEKARITGVERVGARWRLKTKTSEVDADFCIVATGARNPFREMGTKWNAGDTATALGYYVPVNQPHVDIQFLPQLEGYIWVFPRQEHLSVGICGKGETAQKLRERLERYMSDKGIPVRGSEYYGHMLPSLGQTRWKDNRLSGDGWLAVGDAGGLVDPITGEGLYYAIRSGDLASNLVLDGQHSPERKGEMYRTLLRRDFIEDLEFGAALAKRLFLGRFLFRSAPARMVEYIRRSPRFYDLMQDLFAGTQGYLDLKDRFLKSLNFTLQEIMVNSFLRRIVVG